MNKPSDEDLREARAYLLRYARLHLRDAALAEDVVQETLLASYAGTAPFTGRSEYKSWLVGILKHKIVDAIRRKGREVPFSALDQASESEVIERMFTPEGDWRRPPCPWTVPERSLEDRHFWQVFERCLELLPARTARAFVMREVMGQTTDEICSELAITQGNLWTMLHRARLTLRQCLEAHWFGDETKAE